MITKNDMFGFCETHRVLEGAEDYIYLLPHPGLLDWISNYTITFPVQGLISDCYTIVPHGCATVVFSCNESEIGSCLFGPVKLTDKVIPFGVMNAMLNRWISEELERAQNVQELVASMDRLLLSQLHPAYPAEFCGSLQAVIKNNGNISVKELSGSVYYSERHLNRIFDQYLGMNVKTFSRLVRMNRAVRLLQNPRYSITQACDVSGFYDLPHFIHEFQLICGVTPQKYRDRMSDFYSEIAKF